MSHPLRQLLRSRWMDFFMILVFFLTNLTAFAIWLNFWIFITAYELKSPQLVMACIHCILWILVILVLLFNIKKNGSPFFNLNILKEHKLLLLFLTTAILSIFWSINHWISVYKVIVLIGTTLVGMYLGHKFRLGQLINLLFWFFSIVLIFSAALAIFRPGIGTMEGHPYFGAWCGLFWNRNHLASLSALAAVVFLIRLLSKPVSQQKLFVADLLMLALSIIILLKAESATGYILVILLIFAVLIAFLWMKVRHKLKKAHYLLLLGFVILSALLAITQLDFIFRLLNRQTTLTGRVPMWGYLIQNVIGESPWFGYGYGAVWSNGFFREGMHQAVNWPYPLLIADNGYLDVLLAVGILGFVPFILLLGKTCFDSLRPVMSAVSLEDFFPAIFLLYVLVANISFSMFFETETFIWMLVVVTHIMSRQKVVSPA